MLDAPGAGLAAPQIGVGLRVFTYHVDDEQSGHLVNPVLHFPSDETQDGPEGCLSIPGLTFDCVRREHVVAHGQNMYGDPVTVEGTARLARCIQHETDHLDGVLFVDRLDPETRKEAMRAIREAEWAGLSAPRVKVSPHVSTAIARCASIGEAGLRRHAGGGRPVAARAARRARARGRRGHHPSAGARRPRAAHRRPRRSPSSPPRPACRC